MTERERQADNELKELPGPRIGDGPVWRLEVVADTQYESQIPCMFRCRKLLGQALLCSGLADVSFVFDDGKSLLHGHWAMLCEVCEVFQQMKETGMEEWKNNEVRVVGISRASFRGFLEWLYMGKAGPEMAAADGREIWLLAERYQIDGIKQWLITHCLNDVEAICAAMQYALEGDGEGREDLLNACQSRFQKRFRTIQIVNEEVLHGVGACVVREVLQGHARVDPTSYVRGIARYRLVERWMRTNEVKKYVDNDDEGKVVLDALAQAVGLMSVPIHFLRDVVMQSGIVSVDAAGAVLAMRTAQGAEKRGVDHENKYEIVTMFDVVPLVQPKGIALSKECEGLRIALIDGSGSVHVLDVESGRKVFITCSSEAMPSSDMGPNSVAFNTRGEILVCDAWKNRLLLFDTNGVYLRPFDVNVNDGEPELYNLLGVAVNNHDSVHLCDLGGSRVQIFSKNSTLQRSYKCEGRGWCESMAVGADGRIIMSDYAGVQVFDQSGKLVVAFKPPPPDCLHYGVAFGAHGEIVVTKEDSVHVYSAEGEHIQEIKRDVDASWKNLSDVAVDEQGRIYLLKGKDVFCMGIDVKDGHRSHVQVRVVVLAKVAA